MECQNIWPVFCGPQHLPEDMPEHLLEDMPGRMPEDVPDRMPDRMPEVIFFFLAQVLPVTKCINAQGGDHTK